ncbi:C40 family peptidase [Micromonospora krabiensis]|uniref:NlpC/P60 family protein n=1 Tax=Micromonospora krabiensis TaxID=307121 RepID=A0A1C3N345_9ACTN|nr:NlpC/P60 family protein [Micromonospora krabiensis]SBV26991.1 NlpC/P60 family protein [Micromonospora krabiensis]
MRNLRIVLAVVAVAVVAIAGLAVVRLVGGDSVNTAGADQAGPTQSVRPPRNQVERLNQRYELVEQPGPERTEVRRRSDQAVVATLTVGARTVVVEGPRREFTEPSTTPAVIESTSWVRIAPRPWQAQLGLDESFARWLLDQIEAKKPPIDVLGAALQYLADVPDGVNDEGVRYIGDAGFGYVHSADERDGADFYDYLEVPWKFSDTGRVKPSKRWDRDLDCSGYVRLVYGYRFGVPLLNGPVTTTVNGLPRTASNMAAYARSVLVAAGRTPSRPPANLSALQPGDLVFFALHDDPNLITHSGIYLGKDRDGGMRFVSSRGTADGPTFGDVKGDGVVDSGYFGERLRRVIRL